MLQLLVLHLTPLPFREQAGILPDIVWYHGGNTVMVVVFSSLLLATAPAPTRMYHLWKRGLPTLYLANRIRR